MYQSFMSIAAPLLQWHVARRAKSGKELPERLQERFGVAGLARPQGRLVWFHAASVGEAMAILPLVDAALARFAACHVLVTTGTVTSARILAKRLPGRALHQFLPLDRPQWIARFLDHWQPDMAVWTESELWPCWLTAIRERRIPAAMVNGRLSARSARRWKLFSRTLAGMLAAFTVRLAQSEGDATRLSAFAPGFVHAGNLKIAVAAPPPDELAAKQLRLSIAGRPFWLAASTHEGEEAIAMQVHKALAADLPNLLTIIAPRHPVRAGEIAALAEAEELVLERRLSGVLPGPGTAIYLADTMGELALFYAAAPVAFIGGSFTPGIGIHSPVEAVHGKAAIVYGPFTGNNASLTELLESNQGSAPVGDTVELTGIVRHWLHHPDAARTVADAATATIAAQGDIVGRIMAELGPLFARAGL